MKNERINRLANERSNPCVTISMNTHRTHPDNNIDELGLKNLLNEAKARIIKEYGKRSVSGLLGKIDKLGKEINYNHNLESLHIFISNTTKEIIRSPLATRKNTVHISNSFAIKPLIKVLNQTEEYYILLLTQSGVKLYLAVNDAITEEIINDDFPFEKNPHYLTNKEKQSDGKQVDNMVGEFFNEVDKAMIKVHNNTGLSCIVICSEDNYSRYQRVVDKPSMYYGFSHIDNNDTIEQTLAAKAWLIVEEYQHKSIEEAIIEMQEAVGQGKSITNLPEIYSAVKNGRGDLLITHNDYHQAVKMTGETTFELINDISKPEVIDDIISEIAWEVIAKNGRAIFVEQEDIKSLGEISLKIRY